MSMSGAGIGAVMYLVRHRHSKTRIGLGPSGFFTFSAAHASTVSRALKNLTRHAPGQVLISYSLPTAVAVGRAYCGVVPVPVPAPGVVVPPMVPPGAGVAGAVEGAVVDGAAAGGVAAGAAGSCLQADRPRAMTEAAIKVLAIICAPLDVNASHGTFIPDPKTNAFTLIEK